MKTVTKVDFTQDPPVIHSEDGSTGHCLLPIYTPRMDLAAIEAKLASKEASRYIVVLRNGLTSYADVVVFDADEDNQREEVHITLPDLDGVWAEDGAFLGFEHDNLDDNPDGDFSITDRGPHDIHAFDIVFVAAMHTSFKVTPVTPGELDAYSSNGTYKQDVLDRLDAAIEEADGAIDVVK